MANPILHYDIHTLDNCLLLPAGTSLSDDVMAEVAWRGRHSRHTHHSLNHHQSALDDLRRYMSAPPYDAIFADPQQSTACLNLMGEVELVEPFMRVLDYFRQHDRYTYRHMLMVFALTTLLARDLIPDYADRMREAYAGPTHDFGKICIPLNILTKTTPLTVAERRHLEHHPLAGYVLLSYYLRDHCHFSAQVARDHHERKDGSGYPSGRQILDPMLEIITICDIYDALISPRPYRPVSFDNRTALEEITRLAEEGKVGWYVVKALVAHNRRVSFDPAKVWVSPEKRGTPPHGNNYGLLAEKSPSPLDALPIRRGNQP